MFRPCFQPNASLQLSILAGNLLIISTLHQIMQNHFNFNLPDPEFTSASKILISSENFRLAWERVRYFDRPDSKDWIGLKVFASNRDYNLEILGESVRNRTFQPSFPEIKFFPKPSLTLRPMAILPIKDRIVYQAIANVIAEKLRSQISIVSNRQSFANVLKPQKSIPPFEPWKVQYNNFQNEFGKLVEQDCTWIVETDVAAFYETIDHDRLISTLTNFQVFDDDFIGLLKEYLPVWASVLNGSSSPKGVPQGSLASDLLANIFLFRLDETFASMDIHYLRYVDDIRLLSSSKESAQIGLLKLDREFKKLGLLIQTKKTVIRQVISLSKEFDRLSKLLSDIDNHLKDSEEIYPIDFQVDALDSLPIEKVLSNIERQNLDEIAEYKILLSEFPVQVYLSRWFWKLIGKSESGTNTKFDDRHFRFLLWRLEPDSQIGDALVKLLITKPWIGEIIGNYLKKCTLLDSTVGDLKSIIESHKVYDSIVKIAIEILLHHSVSLREYHTVFRKWLAERSRDWPLLSSVLIALGKSEDNLAIIIRCSKDSELSPSVRRMAFIQASKIIEIQQDMKHILKSGLLDENSSVVDTVIYLFHVEWGLKLSDISIDFSEKHNYCIQISRGYDHSLPEVESCYLRSTFSKEYRVQFNKTVDFRNLLGSNYDRAVGFLWQANRSFLVNPSRFVSQIDLFHEELLFFILVDKLQWKNSDQDLVLAPFPNRIKYLVNSKSELRNLSVAMQTCHKLRSSCTEAHTRLHQVVATTQPISISQRDALKKNLLAGYQELTNWVEDGCP
jgi:hypothetical protein